MRALRSHPTAVAGVVVFVLVGVLSTWTVAGTLSRAGTGDATRLTATFHDAAGLRVGDEVRVAGVRVGRVLGTQLVKERAEVTFEVDESQELARSTVVSINYLNLMGQRYLELSRGRPGQRPGQLHSGDEIPVDQTRPALDLTAMFNAFRPLFDALRPGEVNDLARNLVRVLQGEGATLRSLTQQTARLTRHLAARDQVIGQVITNVTAVMRSAGHHKEQIRGLVRELGALTHGLARDRKVIGDSIDDVSGLTTLVADLARRTRHDLHADVLLLDRQAEMFLNHTGSFVETLGLLPVQLATYARTLNHGSYLNTYICELHVQVPGKASVELVPGGTHSERCR